MAFRLLVGVLLLVLAALQYRLWVGEGSLAEVRQLQLQIAAQQTELVDLRERNAALQAEVEDLRGGLEAVEARARGELGMIREGETFFQVIESVAQPNTPASN
jgi:cell division protein FtsB